MSEITQAESRRIVFRARFGSFLVNEYIRFAAQQLSRDIPSEMSSLVISQLTRSDLNKLNTELRILTEQKWNDAWESVTKELERMAVLEGQFLSELYGDVYDKAFQLAKESVILGASRNQLMNLVSGDVTKTGVWAKFVRDNINATTALIHGAVNIGWQEGLTNGEIERNIRGVYNRSTKRYEGGILNKTAVNRAEALVRTGISHFASIARDKTIQANADIIQSRVLWAVFNARTTLICRGRHMKEWDITDNTYPRLPFHFNERSVYVFRLKGEADPFTGARAAKGASGGGQVDADMTMNEFLRSQPREFVVDTLGETRAKLFLDGHLSVDKFTDMQGRVLSLDELKRTQEGERAFRKAGLGNG